ncbi:hypothetical protein ACFWFI_09650 [Streptomyces sp. NPDC060209]|uniref:hypothetical protein n=1 Tax=Streptomyces sp. NPDC060209 TaxID=3347073 RepID=UPI003658689A
MRDPEFLDRTADAIAVMGQAAHDYGPGSSEAQGAAKALEDLYAAADEDDAGH